MTNGWVDIKNTDMMLIMGGNPAENHPCGFKWAIEAKRNRNAKLICVDPRFTRTAANADLFLQIRAGADIAFLGGLINYALEQDRVAKEYIVNYTNAAFVIKEGFKLPEDGLYSGFDTEKRTYNKSSWNYEAGGDLSGQAAAAWAALAATSKTDSEEATARPANQSQNSASGSDTSSKPGGYSQMGAVPTPVALLPPNVAYDLTLQHPRCVYQLMKEQYSR
ncbi:MAG TPA: molybdopterin-dependent oxidoreductase, partial [Terriglobales bacterium]